MSKVIVIGGGPAGMMAAYAAAESGHAVTLLEQNEKLGKKLFITGKGGTGKTYFLKRIIPALKNAVVVAPTGIAAVNAGGQTIHSFFRIGMQPYIPEIRNGKFMDLSLIHI